MISSRRALVATLILLAAACHPDFELTKFPTNEALYRAATAEFARGRWDNAIAAYEKLTTDLPARDTLLPRSHWYLARAHQERSEWVLAATSFSHITESFPDDTLADDASLAAARSYRRLWRKPALDPTYGESALAAYNTLIGLYPTSPLIPAARQEVTELEEMFAQKNYLSGLYYFRRGGYDSGIIYFKDVVTRYPASGAARLAQLRLVESYKKIRYREDAVEACAALRKRFPDDAETRVACTGVAAPPSPVASTPATSPPSSTGPPSPIVPPTP